MAVIVVMVVFGMLQSGSGNFAFAMYQGEEVIGGSEMEFSQLFPSEKPIVLNFWARRCTTSIRANSSFWGWI